MNTPGITNSEDKFGKAGNILLCVSGILGIISFFLEDKSTKRSLSLSIVGINILQGLFILLSEANKR